VEIAMKTIAAALAVCALAGAIGCAPATQTVTIETVPPGATIEVGDQRANSPASVELTTTQDYQVVANKDGYPIGQAEITHQVDWSRAWWQMVLFPVGIAGSVTGSIYSLEPATVSINLGAPLAASRLEPRPASTPAGATPAPPASGPPPAAHWVQIPKEKP
jgi:PEGA domain